MTITKPHWTAVLTLKQEVALVWKGEHSRSWPRLFFFGARYAPIGAMLGNSLGLYNIPHSQEFYIGYSIIVGQDLFSLLVSKVIIILFSNCKNSTSYDMFQGYLWLESGLSIEMLRRHRVSEHRSRHTVGIPVITPAMLKVNGNLCGPRLLPTYVYAFWIPPIIIELVTFCFVMYNVMERRRGSLPPKDWLTTRFMGAITRYSIVYFILMFSVSLINLNIWKHLTIPAFELFIPYTFVLPSVIGNRILLEFRALLTQERNHLGTETIALKDTKEALQGFILETKLPHASNVTLPKSR
ncbi:hypothetical protein M422DRAFT_54262 [Sphaerobolus stellatus SS14]|uniref:Uncharacterized protein n=1 Tax=Sphaerobolus stellatus (strain SS14) TaxID=990650 RepID=A0A0C9TI60_SPHS4|nr:hypothetical protein M422DRAFT_54262 [Sphaerobolus stellatus SS14]